MRNGEPGNRNRLRGPAPKRRAASRQKPERPGAALGALRGPTIMPLLRPFRMRSPAGLHIMQCNME